MIIEEVNSIDISKVKMLSKTTNKILTIDAHGIANQYYEIFKGVENE